MHPIRIAVVTASVLALTACGGTDQKPAATAPATAGQTQQGQTQQGQTQAAPTTAATQKAPTAPLDDLVLAGNTAGMDFKVISAQDKQKGAQAGGGLMKGMKIEPAECQEIMNAAASVQDPSAGAAMATGAKGTAYAAGVSKAQSSTKQVKAVFDKCGTVTVDLGGMKAAAKTTAAPADVPGAAEVVALSTSTELAGQTATTFQKVGIVRGLYVQAFGMGTGVDRAKVDEVFKAQVDKVAAAK